MLILLRREYVELAKRGEKTTTIRPWRTPRGLTPGSRHRMGNYQTAHPVTITGLEHRSIGQLSERDIAADGFASRAAFLAAFRALYPDASPETRVWVIRFRWEHAGQ